ncbi:probable asparagine--tRNA ligase, mitochondrial [Chelonus insularis]|uniref:probable asparagine--tRNA ligase, mitochondrial n=1 Tax=Chelonus insularis TaxID=460826 RepID=UPI001589B8B0|nr:probable asparagine--tRNA ligase, mitochondrial [Chelonus insularis]XP_034938201.1 probable asparagine--tRNA ligase, mitochondrial [Chelonus insularis]
MLRRYCLRNFSFIKNINHCIRNLTNISEPIRKEAGKRIKVQGWVKALRKMKEVVFIDINDGSNCKHIQVVIKKVDSPNNLSYGSSVTVEGEIGYAPDGKMEIKSDDIQVIGSGNLDEGYPFLPRKKYLDEYVRQFLHLRMRTRQFSSVLRLRDLASFALADHMRSRGFINIHTPILTSNDCEGAGEIFTVKPESQQLLNEMKKENQSMDSVYFNSKAFLTVSGQLHLETMARALSKVYTFGPTFRAENSKSRLHLSEFYMMEAELAFITDIKELAEEVELLVKAITRALVEKGMSDMERLNAQIPSWIDKDFSFLTHNEAFNILEKHPDQFSTPAKRNEALAKEHELFLVKYNDGIPLFIIDWPKEMKPFYMKECDGDSSKVAALDLLVPLVGELVGGSLREDNYDKLKLKISSKPDLSWYLDLRKFGNVPTGGFGLGFDRYLQTVLGITNIKDVIPFPRWPHNCSL